MIGEPPEWIRDVLSIPRFAPYLARTNGDVDAAIRLYKWNVEISAAFYTSLHCLELGLRNAMHDRLRTRFGRADWWVVAPLSDNGKRTVSSAVEKLVGRSGRRYTADDIVAELSFGFWVSLVSRGAAYDRTLWVPALHRAFPFYRGKRKPLHDNLLAMVLLRNRIMHHEPVHHVTCAPTMRRSIACPGTYRPGWSKSWRRSIGWARFSGGAMNVGSQVPRGSVGR